MILTDIAAPDDVIKGLYESLEQQFDEFDKLTKIKIMLQQAYDPYGLPVTVPEPTALSYLTPAQKIPAPATIPQPPAKVDPEALVAELEADPDVDLEWGYGNTPDDALRRYRDEVRGDQRMEIVDGETFDRMEGEPIFRGLTDEKHLAVNLSGEWVGRGMDGNGNYFGSVDIATGVADDENMVVFAAKIKPGALQWTGYDALDEQNKAGVIGKFDEDLGRFVIHRLGGDVLRWDDWGHIAILDNSAIVVDGRTLPGGGRAMNAATTAWAKKRYVEKEIRRFKDNIYKQEGLSSQERATAVQEFRRTIERTFDGFTRARKYEIMLREAYGLDE